MNKAKLDDGLLTLISEQPTPEAKVFLQLLREVWQIDWTIAPYDIYMHFWDMDITYFRRYQLIDEGDEAQENQLIFDWVALNLQQKDPMDSHELIKLFDQLNSLRVQAQA